MLNQLEMRRVVDMQHRSYLLLKWMAKAVSEGFVNFETAHDYSTLPEAAEGWILGHYLNIPDNARPPREDLPAFCAFFSTYLTNSFDLVSNPGKQLYSPDAYCFCPMCSWLVNAPNLKTKRLQSADKRRSQRMRVNALLNLATEHRLNVSENEIAELLDERQTSEDASLLAYGYDLLQREKGIANGPAMALLVLSLLPIHGINDANKEALLANMGELAGGRWLALLISCDAVLVLSGAVLTSFVGVNGLVRRMTLDRCLPQFLLKTNRRKTTHRIIIAFFLLSVSVLLITRGEIEALAGVYTISFLAVMALFCLGNILLKVKRARLPRPARAPWPYVLTAFAAVLIGIVGNILAIAPAKIFHKTEDGKIAAPAELTIAGPEGTAAVAVSAGEPIGGAAERISQSVKETGVRSEAADGFLTLVTEETGAEAFIKLRVTGGHFETVGDKETAHGADGVANFIVFLEYFVPAMLIVGVMLGRIALLKAAIFVVRAFIMSLLKPMHSISHAIREKIDEINSQQMVFFTRGDNIAAMNLAMLYVKQNENTNRIKFVTVVHHPDEVPERLRQEIDFLDDAYPSIDIEFVVLEGTFGPELIQQLSERWKIPTNFMFIGSPGDHFVYGLAELGGVRLII